MTLCTHSAQFHACTLCTVHFAMCTLQWSPLVSSASGICVAGGKQWKLLPLYSQEIQTQALHIIEKQTLYYVHHTHVIAFTIIQCDNETHSLFSCVQSYVEQVAEQISARYCTARYCPVNIVNTARSRSSRRWKQKEGGN